MCSMRSKGGQTSNSRRSWSSRDLADRSKHSMCAICDRRRRKVNAIFRSFHGCVANAKHASLRHQPPEARHRDLVAEPRTQPLDRPPQYRLIAADDRLAERRLQFLDGLDLGGVGAAQEISVGLVAR